MATVNRIKIELNTVINGNDNVIKLADDLKIVQESVNKVTSAFEESTTPIDGFLKTANNASFFFKEFRQTVGQLTKDFLSFDQAMRETNTMAGKAGKDFDELKDKVIGLSKEVPIAREALASGLYQVISNGVPEDNWMSFLEASAKSAVGGLADLNGVVTVTSTVIKNYGLEWDAAMAIQDKIQLTAKLGVTSFEQLQQSLPKVTGSAANLGVGIDELLAVFATLTGVTGNTSEVATQLAAVLNALVKPTSEASEMAAAMGIQFNAASIKAAGGLQNFLTTLDGTVEQYAAANGMLAEEVYGKLFGSAESLRALNALTGQLASSYNEKVAAMVDSTGTMAEAYATVGDSAAANSQLFQNLLASITDITGAVLAPIQPFLELITTLGMTAIAVSGLFKAAKGLSVAFVALPGVMQLNAAMNKVVAGSMNALGTSMTTASWGARALKLAIKGLMISTGIGIIFAAVTTAIELFSSASDKAAEKTNEAAKELEEFKKELTDVGDEAGRIAGEETAALERLYKKATDDATSRRDRIKAMEEMKSRWPDYFGKLNSEKTTVGELSRAYEKLKANILNVAKAKAIDEKLKSNMSDKIDQEIAYEAAEADFNDYNDAYALFQSLVRIDGKRQPGRKDKARRELNEHLNKMGFDFGDTLDEDELNAIKSGRTEAEDKMKMATAKMKAIDESNTRLFAMLEDLPAPSDSITPKAAPTDKKPDKRKLTLIDNPETMNDFDNNIRYWEEMQRTVNLSQAQAIQKTIDLLKEERDEFTKVAEVSVAATKKYQPGALDQLNTQEEINKALSYYQELSAKQSGEELAATQRAIVQLQKKQDLRQKELDIVKQLSEAQDIASLSGKQYKVAVKSIGFDSLTAQLEEIDKLLSDPNFTGAFRDELEQLKALLQKFRADSVDIFSEIRNGWGEINNVSSGIDSITQAIEGNGNAWEKTKGIVDGALQVYDGVMAIVGIIQMLTSAKDKDTVSTVTNTIATIASGQAANTDAGAKTAEAGAALVDATAQGVDATAKTTNAAAGFFAAHSWIPWVGLALGLAGVGGMIAMMATLPKFAEGGIAFGPTVGLFGEYQGARTNPEVVAPLSKLRNMLDADGGAGSVEFKIKGETLVGVLNRRTKHISRT